MKKYNHRHCLINGRKPLLLPFMIDLLKYHHEWMTNNLINQLKRRLIIVQKVLIEHLITISFSRLWVRLQGKRLITKTNFMNNLRIGNWESHANVLNSYLSYFLFLFSGLVFVMVTSYVIHDINCFLDRFPIPDLKTLKMKFHVYPLSGKWAM